jgi:phthiocerol/phenolphthiocerol synthesis type-I polyketide synthase E
LFLLSAKSKTSLDAMTDNLHAWLESHPEASLADAAYTLQWVVDTSSIAA